MKMIKTPSYWNEERFQPLVEVKTIYGNTVKIPERSKEFWDFQMKCFEEIMSEQGKQIGLKTIKEILDSDITMRSRECEDFYEVMFENYQEQD